MVEQRNFIARDYQLKAIDEFKLNHWEGIFEMATGTGKTKTSLFATKDYIELNGM